MTAHPLEIIWVLASLLGAVVSLYGTWDAWNDVEALPEDERNGRRTIGHALLWTEGIRFVIQVMYLGLGVPLLFRDNQIGGMVTYVLILTNVLLAVKSYIALRARRQVRRRYR